MVPAMVRNTRSRNAPPEARLSRLKSEFAAALDYFDERQPFTGPSRFFHLRTLERRRRHAAITDALADEELLVDIYATLCAWGLHRMGTSPTKLVEFGAFRRSVQGMGSSLQALADIRMSDTAPGDVAALTQQVWAVIEALDVSASGVKLVAGTKALHHLLPDLVPPVDRRYTLRFFFDRESIYGDGRREFLAVFPAFCEIARDCVPIIDTVVGAGFHTSVTKTIDNALVGYVLSHAR